MLAWKYEIFNILKISKKSPTSFHIYMKLKVLSSFYTCPYSLELSSPLLSFNTWFFQPDVFLCSGFPGGGSYNLQQVDLFLVSH